MFPLFSETFFWLLPISYHRSFVSLAYSRVDARAFLSETDLISLFSLLSLSVIISPVSTVATLFHSVVSFLLRFIRKRTTRQCSQ